MDNHEREFHFTHDDFNFLREVAGKCTGIVLKDDKFNMMYSRLARRIRVLGLRNFKEYCEYLMANEQQESIELINALTTNLTSFFRERHHFDYLSKELIPSLITKRRNERRIRIWSAGCSTGEEAYSIAITLKEAMRSHSGWDVKILATDIDSNVISKANSGVYDLARLEGIPKEQIQRWFRKINAAQEKFEVAQEIRDLIQFKKLNLLHEWPFQGPFDAIFCRNVIIYFDQATKKMLVEKFSRYMHSESRLFLGHSESLFRVTERFELLGKTIYALAK